MHHRLHHYFGRHQGGRGFGHFGRGFMDACDQWPMFDYLEGEFDALGLDAWAILETLPWVRGVGDYCAVCGRGVRVRSQCERDRVRRRL